MNRMIQCQVGLTILATTLLNVVCSTPQAKRTSQLHFDGLYQSEKIDNSWKYARFYEDGTVITVSSTGSPVKISRWFKKENIANKNFSRGRYEIKNGRLVFSSTSAYGTVDYEGVIQDDELILNLHSHINDHRSKGTYRFVQISGN